jgi:hypothetical protein
MVDDTLFVTGFVSTGKVARVAPAGTVTLPGTVAAFVLSLVSTTDVPPSGAAEASVTVPVTGVPPTTVLELNVTLETAGPVACWVTARVKDLVAEPCEAVISAEVLAVTALVATVKLAVVFPSATVTLGGGVATALLLDSATSTPPASAGAVRVTVPVADEPPSTDSGVMLRLESVGLLEFTVSVADRVTPPALAVMTELLLPAVVPAVMGNVALSAPLSIVTLAGTVAAAVLPLDSETTSPPSGAGPLRVTVPVLVDRSTTADGLRLRPESVAAVDGDELIVRTADRLTPPPTAVIVDDVLDVTERVVTVNVALVDPAVTETLAGTVAAAVLPLESDTVDPPAGAAAVSVTVPVADDPPFTDVGLRASAESVGVAGDEVTVQPDRRAFVGVADPSLTSTVQSAGRVYELRSIRKLPPPSLVPMDTPSTVMVRLARARPSSRRFVPLTSARETLTVAFAAGVQAAVSPTASPTAGISLRSVDRRVIGPPSRRILSRTFPHPACPAHPPGPRLRRRRRRDGDDGARGSC